MRKYQIQLESDYADTYSDFIAVSELVLKARGDERLALLKLREVLKNTIKVMEKELNKLREQ